MGKVVLVTGVGRPLGARFVRRVRREPGVSRVIGVDTHPPADPLGDAEFVRADIRQPAIGKVLAEHAVHTVVHMDLHGTGLTPGGGGRGAVKETNVIGAMQLLGACQQTPTVSRLVIKSTTSVYGSAPRDPAVFDEATPARSLPGGGFAKDAVEVEGYVRGFARRRPDVAVTVLRFAHILGPAAESPLAAYFSLPVLPTVLGYDPRLQFVHDDDVIEALRLAAAEPGAGTLRAGTFNIAGEGVLPLSQCARRLGRPTVPTLLPAIRWGGGALRAVGLADFSPEQLRLLTHGRVVATGHARDVLGFTPRRTSGQTLEAFAGNHRPGLLPPATLARAVDRVAQLLPGKPVPPVQDAGAGSEEEVRRDG
ncbi:NAD-dependent epimerase/dehydratase family protein [Streptomyces tubbatahanensis]|uniref:NAD-dependent epimerase/dehydratase family protein n=1 Tax=Streptomyces tubbatahanensis TaxID=2923272 RepID=A0ABY3XUW6_9ACTN|nr:NAD-dependent epimerase/dehydratase family protein [Streptomyces tubbatahanensis]UNS98276.1 NAD-dependent epimerase/dehydratase family protein [Streptomyces tubbatahanensis]